MHNSRAAPLEGRLDSSLYYCNVSLTYWKTKGNHDRIFLNQNLLINLLTKSKDLEKAKLIQKESNLISENSKQHWQGLLDFYVVSRNLFKATKQLEIANSYGGLYSKLVKELTTNGITTRSYFDSQ